MTEHWKGVVKPSRGLMGEAGGPTGNFIGNRMVRLSSHLESCRRHRCDWILEKLALRKLITLSFLE